jgi:hypothetical protein
MASATSENFYTDMNGVFQVVAYNGVSLSREGESFGPS